MRSHISTRESFGTQFWLGKAVSCMLAEECRGRDLKLQPFFSNTDDDVQELHVLNKQPRPSVLFKTGTIAWNGVYMVHVKSSPDSRQFHVLFIYCY